MIAALRWAFAAEIKPSTRKFVLVALADCANDSGKAFPSVAHLCKMTCIDRKAVIASLADLQRRGWIRDTGERSGATKQIPVFALQLDKAAESIPEVEPLNSSDSGTVPEKEQFRFDAETVPLSPGNSTAFALKESRNRDTEPPEPPEPKRATTSKSAARSRADGGTRLPENWEPSPDVRRWASEKFPQIDITEALAEFGDHWRSVPGAKGRKSDWDATFRNSIRRIAAWRKPNGPQPRESAADRAARLAREGDERDQRQQRLVDDYGSDLARAITYAV